MQASKKTLALGIYPHVSLAQARRKAEDARKALAEGIDPNGVKRAQKAEQRSAALNTFDKLAVHSGCCISSMVWPSGPRV